MRYTKAQLANDLAIHLRNVASQVSTLASGMHNPNFCASEADKYAADILDELDRTRKLIERRLARSVP